MLSDEVFSQGLTYFTVSGTIVNPQSDGNDSGVFPDLHPYAGEVIVFTPNVDTVQFRGEPPLLMVCQPVEATIDEQGRVCGADGAPGVRLVASDSELLNPSGWTYKGVFRNRRLPVKEFSVPAIGGTEVNLAMLADVDTGSVTVRLADESAAVRAEAAAAKSVAAAGGISAGVSAAEGYKSAAAREAAAARESAAAAARDAATAASKVSAAAAEAGRAEAARDAVQRSVNGFDQRVDSFTARVEGANDALDRAKVSALGAVRGAGESAVGSVRGEAEGKLAQMQGKVAEASSHAVAAGSHAKAAKSSADAASAVKAGVEDLVRRHGGVPGPQGVPGSPGKGIVNVRTNTEMKLWVGTKSEYDRIGFKDSATLYIVTD